ncbi:glycosyltransferase family 4 protein [Hymenobacter terrestris]|uniref:Glycosyltransferase n=1 Tax=Hymenobacter terrestris TaxID=2748310 RepID=A0ABX2Q6L9_9BACT|nr:glycosyltransferase family 4 protein [Hymenobacter terrestris]NVO85920.1 glycosyltransferase [Hymenobacter terrestris]
MNSNQEENKFLQEELTAARWKIQQLQNELETHLGARKSFRNLLSYGSASVARIARQLYHQYLKDMAAHRRTAMLRKDPHFKPYLITVQPPAQAKRPRVLHVIPSFTTGGSQQLVVDIIEGTGHDFEHEIVTHNDWGWRSYTGVPVTEFPHLNNTKPLKEMYSRFRPDIVHVHYWGNWQAGYPHWKWYHYMFEAAFEAGCKVIQNCNNPLVPYLDARIDRYVYVSQYAQTHFGFPSEHNQVIYPGSNFQLFTRPAEEELPEECIGMVYRLDQDKLNEASIEPFILVLLRRPQTRALIVGSGHYYTYYKQRVMEVGLADRVEFTGMISYTDLPAQYRRLSLFVAPVHKESFGQVTPFAMNMRIPVVGYDVGALGEILQDESILAPAGDVGGLADRIIGLLNDRVRLRTMGVNNQQRAATWFAVETMAASYHQLYRQQLADCDV